MFYGIGSSETLFSPWSSPFRTLDLSVPGPIEDIRADLDSRGGGIVLKFKDPEDDGGSAITGYSVYTKYSEDNLKRSWHLLSTHFVYRKEDAVMKRGDLTSIGVRNIVPAAEIRFRVSCHNILGESLPSPQSTKPLRLSRQSQSPKEGGLVLDCDRELVVTPACSSHRTHSLEVWSARHPSPYGSIGSESVFIDESLKMQYFADSDFNSTCVRAAISPAGAIAIIPRSEEPIVAIALRLQVPYNS